MAKENILEMALGAQKKGVEFVVANVIEASSGSPAREGFKIIYFASGDFSGTVGGGKLEKCALEICKKTLLKRKSTVEDFTLTEEKLGMICGGSAKIYFEYFGRGKSAFIFGAGHISSSLKPTLCSVGFRTVVVDNRQELAETSKFGQRGKVDVVDYQDYATSFEPNQNDSVVILTHGHKFDYVVLKTILKRELKLKYLGLIGSKHKLKKLFENLQQEGIKRSDIKKVFAPIGLNITKGSHQEIAVAIAAEMIAVYNNVANVDFCKNSFFQD